MEAAWTSGHLEDRRNLPHHAVLQVGATDLLTIWQTNRYKYLNLLLNNIFKSLSNLCCKTSVKTIKRMILIADVAHVVHNFN